MNKKNRKIGLTRKKREEKKGRKMGLKIFNWKKSESWKIFTTAIYMFMLPKKTYGDEKRLIHIGHFPEFLL